MIVNVKKIIPTLKTYPSAICYYRYNDGTESWTWLSNGTIYCASSEGRIWACTNNTPEEIEVEQIEDDPKVLIDIISKIATNNRSKQ